MQKIFRLSMIKAQKMFQVTPQRLKSGHGEGEVSLLLALAQIAGLVVDTALRTK
jgi:hypothetical protein